ncbi:MAG: hypothetical protein GWP03_05405 [Proteobacteria bacterium]|nr:hypothetical protein [Pseudomonadota bacterium]
MKRVMLFVLVFLLFTSFASAEISLGDMNANVSISDPMQNLFYTDPGFLNPAYSHGMVGSFLNPAGLSKDLKKINVGFAFSFTQSSSFSHDITLYNGEGSTFNDTINTNLSLNFEDKGGFDFFGVATRLGPLSLTAGMYRSEGYEMAFTSDSNESRFTVTKQLHQKLTHSELSQIPEGDTIPVIYDLYSEFIMSSYADFDAQFISKPTFYIGGSFGNGIVSGGAGIKFRAVNNHLVSNSYIRAGLDTLSMGVTPDSGTDWTVNLNATEDQSVADVFAIDGDNSISKFITEYYGGILIDIRMLKIGLALDYTPNKPSISSYNFDISKFDSININVNINSDSANVTVDTTGHVITGTIPVSFFNVASNDTSFSGTFGIPGTFDGKLGAAFGFPFISTGFSGGFLYMSGDGLMLGKAHATGSFILNVPHVPIRFNVEGVWPYLYLNGKNIPLTPYVNFGGGLSVLLGPVSIDGTVKISASSLMLNKISDGIEGVDLKKRASLGLGFRLNI